MSSASDFGKEAKQPRNIYAHPTEFIDYIQQTLGVINAFRDFDHFFQNAELFMTLIKRTDLWLQSGADGLAADTRFQDKFPKKMPIEAFQKIWKVWRGKVWRICVSFTYLNEDNELVVDIDSDKSYFVYERPTMLLPDETGVPVPALKHLIPTSQIKDRTELGVKIREQVDFAKAWYGYDHAIMNTDGGFHYNFTDEQRPFFESDEQILELKQKGDYVSPDYYNTVIDILIEEYERWETILFLFLQALIKTVKTGTQGVEGDQEEVLVAQVPW